MEKTVEAFRTIGEVADELDLPQHVLRFWETKFTQIRPVKRAGGRRYYRPDDIRLVAAIRVLLYSEGYTIKGVQRILKEQGVRAVIDASAAGRSAAPASVLAPTSVAPTGVAPAGATLAAAAAPPARPAEGGFSPENRHRLEAVLAELTECARLLA